MPFKPLHLPWRISAGLAATVVLIAVLALGSFLNAGRQPLRVQGPADLAATRFGIIYSLWHCLALNRTQGRPHDIAKAISGQRPWGPVPEFHFWSEPAGGYYCLADRPDVLRRHAEQLRDAGIDFVIIDATNNEFADARTPDSPAGIMAPFRAMLDVWSTVPGAPRIVPWAPLTARGNMLESLTDLLGGKPDLAFRHDGKPLALIADNHLFRTDSAKAGRLAQHLTLRPMWGLLRGSEARWSFMEPCESGFLASGGEQPCNQPAFGRNGVAEQIPIAAAYQDTFISRKTTAVPKFHGRTLVRQFETLATHYPGIPIVTIAGWNEWMAQRYCLRGGEAAHTGCTAANDHWPDGTKVFVDQYDAEYSRDIELAATPPGAFYYRLMAACIARYRAGLACNVTDGDTEMK